MLASAPCQTLDLEPYDTLRITSPNFPSLDGLVVIDGLGVAALPLGGRMILAGLPMEAARQRVQSHFQAYLGFPALNLTMMAVSNPNAPVRFFGSIEKPGTTYPSKGLRLADILQKSEPNEVANLDAVQVRGADRIITVRVDLAQPNGGWNLELFGGDRVYFPAFSGPLNVFVLGAVMRPGAVDFRRGLTVRQALELAGGAKPDGDIGKVEVLRNNVRLGALDLNLSDQPLRPGDAIRVPVQPDAPTILVVGGVLKPGRAPFRAGLTLYTAIQEAGGLVPGVKLGKVKIVRLVEGRSIGQTHDLGAIVNGRAPNPVLQPGDRIEVPEPPF